MSRMQGSRAYHPGSVPEQWPCRRDRWPAPASGVQGAWPTMGLRDPRCMVTAHRGQEGRERFSEQGGAGVWSQLHVTRVVVL